MCYLLNIIYSQYTKLKKMFLTDFIFTAAVAAAVAATISITGPGGIGTQPQRFQAGRRRDHACEDKRKNAGRCKCGCSAQTPETADSNVHDRDFTNQIEG